YFLLETRGKDKLLALYRSAGDFQGVYGVPLAALEKQWHAALAQVPLSELERERAFENLRRPAIWHKVCAHALAALRQRAGALEGGGNLTAARRCLERVAQDDPDEPQNWVALAELEWRAKDLGPAPPHS